MHLILSYPVAQCVARRAPMFCNAYDGWFAPPACHSVRMTYRPSTALRLLGSLWISHNKFLPVNKWILLILLVLVAFSFLLCIGNASVTRPCPPTDQPISYKCCLVWLLWVNQLSLWFAWFFMWSCVWFQLPTVLSACRECFSNRSMSTSWSAWWTVDAALHVFWRHHMDSVGYVYTWRIQWT